MNPAVAYLVIACGTGGDNRTSKWSTNAIEARTGISRSRSKEAITKLEEHGAVWRDPDSKPDRPKYKLRAAHDIPWCEGFPPTSLAPKYQPVLDFMRDGWVDILETTLPKDAAGKQRLSRFELQQMAKILVDFRFVERHSDGQHYRTRRYDEEAAIKPDWIWLPNSLINGIAEEVPPVELVRQTGDVLTLRLLVNLYGAHRLHEDGGIHFRRIREQYDRHQIGQRGQYVVWGFVPKTTIAWKDTSFVAPHFREANEDESQQKDAWEKFSTCWNRLKNLGLIELVAHLIHTDSDEGEIIHPMARGRTGQEIERAVSAAAQQAAEAMLTEEQVAWSRKHGFTTLAPVPRHIEDVQMVGIARLRYRPWTAPTKAFVARDQAWQDLITRFRALRAGFSG